MKSQTHVTFVLDSSGSMSKIADDTRGGFNTFLMEQREEEGEAAVTLYDFDSTVELVYRGSEIADAETLDTDNYRPGGKTALHDAIARAIDETDDYIAAADVENVIIVVLTDGKENASETPQNVVRELRSIVRSTVGNSCLLARTKTRRSPPNRWGWTATDLWTWLMTVMAPKQPTSQFRKASPKPAIKGRPADSIGKIASVRNAQRTERAQTPRGGSSRRK